MSDRILSEGEQWTIWDQLDGQVAMTFSSWTHYDAETRAREAFAAYPRQASLWRERLVKYEKDRITYKADPRGTTTTETTNETTNEGSN